jgi:hypothetical protein
MASKLTDKGSLAISALDISKYHKKSLPDEIMIDKSTGELYYNIKPNSAEYSNQYILSAISFDRASRKKIVEADISEILGKFGLYTFEVSNPLFDMNNIPHARTTISLTMDCSSYLNPTASSHGTLTFAGLYVDAIQGFNYNASSGAKSQSSFDSNITFTNQPWGNTAYNIQGLNPAIVVSGLSTSDYNSYFADNVIKDTQSMPKHFSLVKYTSSMATRFGFRITLQDKELDVILGAYLVKVYTH